MDTTVVSYVDSLARLGYTSLTDAINMIKGVAPDIWEIYVRQAYVDSIFCWVSLVTSLSFFCLSIKKVDWYNGNSWLAICIISALAIFATLIAGTIGCNLFTVIFNPEYAAIQRLLGR